MIHEAPQNITNKVFVLLIGFNAKGVAKTKAEMSDMLQLVGRYRFASDSKADLANAFGVNAILSASLQS